MFQLLNVLEDNDLCDTSGIIKRQINGSGLWVEYHVVDYCIVMIQSKEEHYKNWL